MVVDWLALQTFVLLATAAAVAYYAHTAREQLEATRDLIEATHRQVEAAQRQLEATHAPCIVPVALSPHVQLHNVGSGPALNVRYLHTPQTDFAWPPGLANATPCPPIAAGGVHAIIETSPELKSPHFFRIQYESSSGHRYQTEATILGRASTVDVRLRRL